MPDLPPLPDDDDALAEAIADAWIEQAATDPAIQRAALRAAGLLKEPADMTVTELALEHGTDRHTLNRVLHSVLRRLKHHPKISHLKSSPHP